MKKVNHGGARKGAGRPKKENKRLQLTVTLPAWQVHRLSHLARLNDVSVSGLVEVGLSRSVLAHSAPRAVAVAVKKPSRLAPERAGGGRGAGKAPLKKPAAGVRTENRGKA